MLWKKEVDFKVLCFLDSIIHDRFCCSINWVFIGVGGCPEMKRRKVFWAFLKSLKLSVETPRLVAGDFNKILTHCEKQEGRVRPKCQLEEGSIVACDLRDLGFLGTSYT